MPGRGPAPTPTKLRIARGSKRKTLAGDAEPQPKSPKSVPKPPSWLNKTAAAEWRRMAADLHEMGVLTTVDLGLFAGYCEAFGRYRWGCDQLEVDGYLNGGAYKTGALKVAEDALTQMLRIAQEFGFTPAARTRIKATPKKKADESVLQKMRKANQAG